MNHFSFELSLVALVPAVILCGYVFYKDRVEKEPLGLLALLFGVGIVAYVPSYFLQELIIRGIDAAFAGSMSYSAEGAVSFSSAGTQMAHTVICAFFGFSLIQVCIKWCMLFLITHKSKNFNYLFDGIVYSTFLTLGFAIAENIHFALQNDWELISAKLLTSIPFHLFIGVLMGYYYTMWRVRFLANGIENRMLEANIITKDNVRSSAAWLICSLCIPVVINSIYIFAGTVEEDLVIYVFYFATFILYGLSFIAINRLSSRDSSSKRYLCRLIAKGHPELSQEQIEIVVKGDLIGKEIGGVTE